MAEFEKAAEEIAQKLLEGKITCPKCADLKRERDNNEWNPVDQCDNCMWFEGEVEGLLRRLNFKDLDLTTGHGKTSLFVGRQ